MMKGSGRAYNKWNISVVICYTYIPDVYASLFDGGPGGSMS